MKMATTKKIIGSVPTTRGEYKEGEKYYKQNIVSYLGSAFISTIDENMSVPCVVQNGKFVLNEGWAFLVDNSEFYFYKDKEVDLTQDEFDRRKEEGSLDITKDYYTYEE
jgi:hypothetical protein